VTEGNYALPDGTKVEVSEDKDTQDSDKAKGDEP